MLSTFSFALPSSALLMEPWLLQQQQQQQQKAGLISLG
jgi:hypothetical protein